MNVSIIVKNLFLITFDDIYYFKSNDFDEDDVDADGIERKLQQKNV